MTGVKPVKRVPHSAIVQVDLCMLRAKFIISMLLIFFSCTLPVAADTGRKEIFRQVLAQKVETMPWVSMTPELINIPLLRNCYASGI